MMRMVRAALIGIVVGVVGGAIVGQVYYARYMSRMIERDKNKAVNALVYSDDSVIYGDVFEAGFEEFGRYEIKDSYSGLFDFMESDASASKTDSKNDPEIVPEIIQLNVIYNGNETLTSDEKADLQKCVKQAVLYALAEKLGEDYNQSMTKSEVRRNLILSLEYINQVAGESAKEWGINANTRASFDVQYLQENEIDGVWCPAGYYEVLKIYLSE